MPERLLVQALQRYSGSVVARQLSFVRVGCRRLGERVRIERGSPRTRAIVHGNAERESAGVVTDDVDGIDGQ
ncbi:MAG: hypothetical protein WBY94_15615, partial [Polyangiaceae bacterium]